VNIEASDKNIGIGVAIKKSIVGRITTKCSFFILQIKECVLNLFFLVIPILYLLILLFWLIPQQGTDESTGYYYFLILVLLCLLSQALVVILDVNLNEIYEYIKEIIT
jgi:hypothetical protein